MCYLRTIPDTLTSWSDLGARLAEARKAARLSQAELAAAVQLERTAVTKIEAGERKLDSLELARAARVLRRPIDWFVTPSLPAVVSRRKSREAIEESQADVLLESLARDVKLLIELRLLEPPQVARPRAIEGVESAEAAARELRRTLGLTPAPVWDLLSVAERVGLYGFSIDLRDEALDGSYARLENAGVALVNGGRQTGRRRFTLVHELGHHLFADDYSPEWIVGSDGDDRERLINAFVIHFLMPREAVLTRWQDLDDRLDARQAAIVLGAEFGVSWTAVLGHLCNLELIAARTRELLERDRPTKADYLEGGIVLREELGAPAVAPRFAQAVVRAYKRHKVSSRRTLELLRDTLTAAELPPEDRVPRESMRAQFDLD
jgi:Zn-dependent peptidase ImmA (M78 family)/DNA-binding XRE family transcriptional regulator